MPSPPGTQPKNSLHQDDYPYDSIPIGICDSKEKWEGIDSLLDFCVYSAMHTWSGGVVCHPDTREEYIRSITSWGKGEGNSKEKRAFLMTGPAGAGKSAIARSCARSLQASGTLGASFFFHRAMGWNNPKTFIPTIVYQLTSHYPAYRDYIDDIILGSDKVVLGEEMDIQFRELLVKPLQKLNEIGQGIPKDLVIVIDGLDECATVEGRAQIIKLITTSCLGQSTPFLWAIFSRPEPHITSAFSSDTVMNVSWQLPLTVSSNADIETYIRSRLQKIRAKHNIPSDVVWPEEEEIHRLVSQSAGSFVYPAAALRFIRNPIYGLEERLQSVLQLGSTSTENSLSTLDQLYTLIMTQIPEYVLPDTLSLLYLDLKFKGQLLLDSDQELDIGDCRSALGLPWMIFVAGIAGNLDSVLKVELIGSFLSSFSERLKVYHSSCVDFLFDETRSGQFHLQSATVLQHCVKLLVQRMVKIVQIGGSCGVDRNGPWIMQLFFTAVEDLDGELEEDTLRQMTQIDWACWRTCFDDFPYTLDIRKFIEKIPTDWRHRIIRPSRQGLSGTSGCSQILADINPEKYLPNAYIIGEGDKKALMIRQLSRYKMCRIC